MRTQNLVVEGVRVGSLIFFLFFGGTNFIQKFISISKNLPRLMKLSEIHQHISELVWRKFGWWNFIPSWAEFCVCVLFSLILGSFVIWQAGLHKNWDTLIFTPLPPHKKCAKFFGIYCHNYCSTLKHQYHHPNVHKFHQEAQNYLIYVWAS